MTFRPKPPQRGRILPKIPKLSVREAYLAHEKLPPRQKATADENKRLDQEAKKDPLTGLFNRRVLNSRLKLAIKEFKATENRPDHKQPALLYIDINSFKALNDHYGHGAGDILLKRMANTLTGNTRKLDTVARVGGDEIVILLNNILVQEERDEIVILLDDITPEASLTSDFSDSDQEKTMERIVERHKELLTKTCVEINQDISISCPVSIGVKIIDQNSTPLSVINAADQAMGEDKKAMYERTGYNRGSVENLIIRHPDQEALDLQHP